MPVCPQILSLFLSSLRLRALAWVIGLLAATFAALWPPPLTAAELWIWSLHASSFFFFFFFFFFILLTAFGSSQIRGCIRAISASPTHTHRTTRSKPHWQPTPQLHSNTLSLTHWAKLGIEPASSWALDRFVTSEPQWELPRHSSD